MSVDRNSTEFTNQLSAIAQRYSLLQQQSGLSGKMFEAWYRPDMLLFIERWVVEEGKIVDKFRILPHINDVDKVGHIDFTEHYYEDFEEAVKNMIAL